MHNSFNVNVLAVVSLLNLARKTAVVGGVMAVLAIAAIAVLTPQVGASASSDRGDGSSIEVFNARILAVGDSTITVEREGEEMELAAEGMWLMVAGKVAKVEWSEAAGYIESREALVAMVTLNRGDSIVNVLLGLRQGGNIFIRPALLKRSAARHVHMRAYLSVRGEIAEKGENYLLIKRGDHMALVVTGGAWLKAGEGETTWEEASASFNPGDTVRVFCHNILVLRKEAAEAFGIRAVIWGYSGAIINLSNGTALSKA